MPLQLSKKLPFSTVDGLDSVGIEQGFPAVWLPVFDKQETGPCQLTLKDVLVDYNKKLIAELQAIQRNLPLGHAPINLADTGVKRRIVPTVEEL